METLLHCGIHVIEMELIQSCRNFTTDIKNLEIVMGIYTGRPECYS